MAALTIEDIRNPARKSGFDHVNSAKGGSKPGNDNETWSEKWRASWSFSNNGSQGVGDRGPSRSTPEEAAQDYVDHVNGQGAQRPQRLNSAQHPTRRKSQATPEALRRALAEARAAQEPRQGYVYMIGEEARYAGYILHVKIGYSVEPEARVGELQVGNPRKLVLLATKPAPPEEETRLHSKLHRFNTIGEWFRATPEVLGSLGIKSNVVPA